ncbi:hypothetical protein PDIG_24080 [Penicillium digitatum PHI26]|uniref:Uncharacterized protein n=3 Tax=Penicillium digitatum TaxID=36651 RepID=K9G4D7_PEND2|nr:hypothetical protein PDIP_58580 [Penicillium digitatum Pd1]EKV10743.1 hypothetical protein PDIP_58580 [Penicillium digitatum Pd1]EKV15762.1 hypothetical protein PDIG_24080 [Penicillium digitatum PHI26]
MKPRSAGNSPSSGIRKRSAVNQNVMHGLPTQYQSSLEEAFLASAARNSRPMSWHPSSTRTRGLSNPYISDFPSDGYAGMGPVSDQYPNSANYCDENILSYSITADPSFSPGYFPIYSTMQEDLPLPQHMPAVMSSSQIDSMGWDVAAMSTDLSTMSHPASDIWNFDMLSMGTNIPPPETTCPSYVNVPSPGDLSGPSTPDFLPIQQFEDPFQLTAEPKKTAKGEEELVGMGLYSQPNGTLARAPQSKSGEGLKLEETFTPSDEDKDDETDEVEIIGQHEVPQQPTYHESASTIRQSHFTSKQQPKQALNFFQRSFFFDTDDTDQQPMAVVQPFAGFNQPCLNYGYGWI